MTAGDALIFIVGALAGVVIAVVVLRRRAAGLSELAVRTAISETRQLMQLELIEARERLAARTAQVEQSRTEAAEHHLQAEALRASLMSAREDGARLASELSEARSRAIEQANFLQTSSDMLKTQFKTLAAEILEEKGKHLSELHRGELGLVLGPLSDRLASFQKKVEEVYVAEGQQRFSLFQEVQKLQAASLKLGDDATNLTRALKGESKIRGNWGEVMLEAILERSGLVKGREYHVQMTLTGSDGKLRPDVVVHLPDQKHIVIDSKVSLVAYDRYYSAENELDRDIALREHVDSMRRHFVDLGKKNYQSQDALNSPDFVAMFVPIEPAFNLAAGADANLIFDAFDKKVVLVSPGTLLAMLSTVATLWRREQQSRNALEIARQSGEIYDKFVLVVQALTDVGRRLDSAQEAFAVAKGRLTDGPGNVMKRLEDLKKLGAKANKSLPADLLAQAGVADQAAISDSDLPPLALGENHSLSLDDPKGA